MVTFHQLVQLDVEGLERFADRWAAIHRVLHRVQEGYHDAVAQPLVDGHWQGESGEAATAFCSRVHMDLEALGGEVKGLRDFLDKEADGAVGRGGTKGLEQHQRAVLDYQQQAAEHGMHVTADGDVEWAELLPRHIPAEEQERLDRKQELADDLSKKIKHELAEATKIDEWLATSLKVVFGTRENFETENRRFDSVPATAHDRQVYNQLNNVAAYMAVVKGWPTAAGLVQHYLDGTGKPVEVEPATMLEEIPQFRKDADATLANDVRKRPDGPFTTEWRTTAPNTADGDSSLEWYYALNHFQYRMVGEKHDGRITYHVEVRKRYDWGIPSEHRRTLDGGVVELEQADIAHLHSAGMAQDFDVSGSSDTMTASA
jgi:hypothetical protein